MVTPIHEYFPLEVFSLILLDACHTAGAHNDRQAHSHQTCDSMVRVAIKFSSVCREWRCIVTSLPLLWSNIEFTNFLHPNPRDAMTCVQEVLRRSDGRFHRVCLDFSSLKDVTNAEDIINKTLEDLLACTIAPPLSSYELCVTAAKDEHMDAVSDHFLSAPSASLVKLESITTLRLVLIQDPPAQSQPTPSVSERRLRSYRGHNEALPRFNILHFKYLANIHLTNVRILVFPTVQRQLLRLSKRLLQIYLDNWTNQIDSTLLITAAITPDEDDAPNLSMIPNHIITNSAANIVDSPLSSTPAFTIVFPDAIITSNSTFLIEPSSFDTLTRLLPHRRIRHLVYLELSNITPQIWLTFLGLLKQIPPTLLAFDRTPISDLSWRHLVVRFAPLSINQSSRGSPPSLEIAPKPRNEPSLDRELKDRLRLGFNFTKELSNVACVEELGVLMRTCLKVLPKSTLPQLETFDCHDHQGRHWRTRLNGDER